MPPRKRKSRRRADELDAWETAFISEFDFFGDLDGIGVETTEHGRPDRDVAEEAWTRLGAAFLDGYDDKHVVPWALIEFGDPRCR